MGFTRYYTVKNKLDKEKFKEYSKVCKQVCEYLQKEEDYKLCNYEGEIGSEPVFSEELISFNGEAELSHESFGISTSSNGFDFTKTARKPYDSSVFACLYLAKIYFGDDIKVSGDDDEDDNLELISTIKQFLREQKLEVLL